MYINVMYNIKTVNTYESINNVTPSQQNRIPQDAIINRRTDHTQDRKFTTQPTTRDREVTIVKKLKFHKKQLQI